MSTLLQQSDAFLRSWDEMWAAAVAPRETESEREKRLREGKARQMAWLMKREGMK